eukprot:3726425-Prymnesium_polylepis.1
MGTGHGWCELGARAAYGMREEEVEAVARLEARQVRKVALAWGRQLDEARLLVAEALEGLLLACLVDDNRKVDEQLEEQDGEAEEDEEEEEAQRRVAKA